MSLIQTDAQLDAAMEDIATSTILALDAEMDSYFSYYPKLCLVQVSTERHDYLIDPFCDLDFREFAELLEDPQVTKVLHAAENDIPYLKERFDCGFVNLFDSHLAAKVLGLPRSGLAPLLEEHFQVKLDKKFQTADWRQRPLPHDMAEYAKTDTRYLIRLRDLLADLLEEQELWPEAEGLFRKACQARMQRKEFNPDGWVKLDGVRKMSTQAKARTRELYLWRNLLAERLDSAVFRVLPESILISLVHAKEISPPALRASYRHGTIQRHADELSRLLEEAEKVRTVAMPARKAPDNPLSPAQQKQFDRLRQWRNQMAESQQIDPDRVLSNRVLKSFVKQPPATLQDLNGSSLLEPWRFERYGQELWQQWLKTQA